MKQINRRDFIKAGAGAAVATGSLLPMLTQAGIMNHAVPGPRTMVSAVRGLNLDSMTRDAIEAIGGMGRIVDKGEKVFIKPNLVSFPWAPHNNCFHRGECTKPEIIIAAAEECLKAGAAEVIVGDGSHMPRFEWKHAVTLDGSTNLVEAAAKLNTIYKGKLRLACLEADSPHWVNIPSQTKHGKIAISSLVANADKVISIPVAKTHSWAQVTLAAKNFIGVTPLSKYAQKINNTWWNRGSFDHSSPRAIGQVYLDITRAVKPALTIVDFSIGIEGNGPTRTNGGKTLDVKDRIGAWAIIAGTDIMATEATAARMMDHDPEKIRHLMMGVEMGLGTIQSSSIEFKGESPENLHVEWQHASQRGWLR